MARKISMSQFRNKMRQLQNKQKQTIDKYNREVRQYNQKVNRAINQYNNEVRKHNARVRANRQKIASELRRIKSSTAAIRYKTIRTSAIALNNRYEQLDAREREFENVNNGASFLDLSERENANSLEVSNLLESNTGGEASNVDPSILLRSDIDEILASITPELGDRWKGALFSLNPNNPDAARHFCTSAREVFIQILDINAPDNLVEKEEPNCARTEAGVPTRRAKIKFMLRRAGIINEAATDFVDEDVNNVLNLFRVFNDGTHGSSGKFSISQLLSIKTRVENGITYLSSVAGSA